MFWFSFSIRRFSPCNCLKISRVVADIITHSYMCALLLCFCFNTVQAFSLVAASYIQQSFNVFKSALLSLSSLRLSSHTPAIPIYLHFLKISSYNWHVCNFSYTILLIKLFPTSFFAPNSQCFKSKLKHKLLF